MAKNDFDCTTLTPEQRDARLALDVERLLRFGRKHKLIKELDELVARNTLLDLLQLAAPARPNRRRRTRRPPPPCWTKWWNWLPARNCLTVLCPSTASTSRPA